MDGQYAKCSAFMADRTIFSANMFSMTDSGSILTRGMQM